MPLLTDALARAAEPPTGKDEITIYDDHTPGLALRVRSTGAKSWIWRRRDGQRTARYTIGSAATIKAAAARLIAEQHNLQLTADTHGFNVELIDKNAKRNAIKNAGPTLRDFWPTWRAHLEKNGRSPRTIEEYRRHIVGTTGDPDIGTLADKPAKLIKRSDITAVILKLEETKSARTAAAVRSTLSSLFSWLLSTDRVSDDMSSPVANSYNPDQGESRARVLSREELRAIWRAARNIQGDYGLIVRLLMLTGLRRLEVGGLRRSEFIGDMLDIVASRMKNKLPHIMPLSSQALEIVAPRAHLVQAGPMFGRGKNGYSGWSKSFERFAPLVDREFGSALEPWILHDLRRSLVTYATENGMAEVPVIELFIAHVSGESRKGVAGVYNRAKLLPQRRRLAQDYADWLMAIVS